jgi:glycosyltransferase involved in cell wall biosynthesis
MGTPTAVLLSYRLGGRDGVSVEAGKWQWALETLGFASRRVAGEFEDDLAVGDICLPFLGREHRPGVASDVSAVSLAIADADLVVVENLCSLPLNVDAALAAAAALDRISARVVFHHHDLPWERTEFESYTEFPPHRPNSLHVTISDQAASALAHRGLESVTIRNAFDLDVTPGRRDTTRRRLGFAPEDIVVLQPTRAIERKDVGRGVRLAEQLALDLTGRRVRYWLTGPAEDGYATTLAGVLGTAQISTTHAPTQEVADAYAASDLVVMPSRWEGFGNPVVEAMVALRPVASAPYPVLRELVELGLQVLPIDDPGAVARFVEAPDVDVLWENRAVVARELSLADLPRRLTEAFGRVGWSDW